MAKVKYLILGIVIGLVTGVLYRQYSPKIIHETTTTTKYKVIKETKYLDKPKIVSVVLPDDTVFIPADTAELIKKYKELHKSYYKRRTYRDTLTFDSLGYCVVEQEVTKNRIGSLRYSYSLTIPEKITYTIAYQKNSLYIGGLIGKELVAPTIEYTHKKYTFGLGYNFWNNGFVTTFRYKIR